MELGDWSSQLADELSSIDGTRYECRTDPRPGAAGYVIRSAAGYFGFFVMQDGSEVSAWPLDADGKTGGPAWVGELSSKTWVLAAIELVKVIKALPKEGCSFSSSRPLGTRDHALESVVNDAWRVVRTRIEQTNVAANPASIAEATAAIERFIDEHLQAGDGNLQRFAYPFKVQAAEIIRDKAESETV